MAHARSATATEIAWQVAGFASHFRQLMGYADPQTTSTYSTTIDAYGVIRTLQSGPTGHHSVPARPAIKWQQLGCQWFALSGVQASPAGGPGGYT